MKPRKIFLLVLFALCFAPASFAQDYSPSTTWPYLFKDFTPATIYLRNSNPRPAAVNILLTGNKLHFVDGEFVKEMNLLDVDSLKIGQDLYVNASGEMLQVKAVAGKARVVIRTSADMSSLNETGGAYGSSSATLGTMALSSLEGIGATNSSASINHVELRANREEGESLTLKKDYYIFINGILIEARKSVLQNYPGVGAKEFKDFCKSEKIKFNKEESLTKVAGFLSERL